MSRILILQTWILLRLKENTHILVPVYRCLFNHSHMKPTSVNAFRAVNPASLKELRGKNYQGSNDEWSQIVSYVLGQLPPAAANEDWTTGIETLANISGSGDSDKTMIITIRKRIQKITVCLFDLCEDCLLVLPS